MDPRELCGEGTRPGLPPETGWSGFEPRPGVAGPGPAGSGPRGLETVLVADDDPVVRTVVEDILRMHGYTVLGAANGREALRLAQEYDGTIDLLLTDVEMPEMHGRDLARRLAVLRPETRILFLRSPSSLPKPFGGQSLGRKVREILDGPGAGGTGSWRNPAVAP